MLHPVILQITHSQWIFRNVTLHDKVRGTLHLKERKEVLKEVGQLIETDPADVPMESRFLLEFYFDSLSSELLLLVVTTLLWSFDQHVVQL